MLSTSPTNQSSTITHLFSTLYKYSLNPLYKCLKPLYKCIKPLYKCNIPLITYVCGDDISDGGITVVHGGLMPDVPLEEQEEFVMTRMRNLIPDGNGGYIPSGKNNQV